MRWCFLVLVAAACGAGDRVDREAEVPSEPSVVVDHEGVEHTLRGGFSFQWEDGTWAVVLSDFDRACERYTWWTYRRADLLTIWFDHDVEAMEAAIANTRAVYADEMGTLEPFTLWLSIDHAPSGETFELPGADLTSTSDDSVFWASASVDGAPEYTWSEDGSSSWGPESGYEAAGLGGSGTFTLSEAGAHGSFATQFRTDELEQFDVDVDFEVEACPGLVDAFAAVDAAWGF